MQLYCVTMPRGGVTHVMQRVTQVWCVRMSMYWMRYNKKM